MKKGFPEALIDTEVPRLLFQRLRSEAFVNVSPGDVEYVAQHCRMCGLSAPLSPGLLVFEELVHILTCIGDLGDYEAVLTLALQVRDCAASWLMGRQPRWRSSATLCRRILLLYAGIAGVPCCSLCCCLARTCARRKGFPRFCDFWTVGPCPRHRPRPPSRHPLGS